MSLKVANKNVLRFICLYSLAAVFILSRSWQPFIFFTDELQLEETSYQMSQRHDFVIPRMNDEVFFNKPPLYSWLTAPLYWVFPPLPFIRRVWTILFAFALVVLLYKVAKDFYGHRVAFWSVLFLIGNSLFISYTKAGNLDIPNAFFCLLVIYLYNLGKKNPFYLSAAGITLGISLYNRLYLALIPLPIIFLDLLIFPKERPQVKSLLVAGFWLFIVGLPWYLIAYLRYPQEFISEFISYNFVGHALTLTPGDTSEPFWFYLSSVLSIPATAFALMKIVSLLYKKTLHHFSVQNIIWVIYVLLLLSLLPTRHEWYGVVLLPPLSILGGMGFTNLLSYLQARKKMLLHYLSHQFVLALVFIPFLSFILTPNLNAETITVLNVMVKRSSPHEPIFTYPYPYLYTTTLFHPRSVQVLVNTDEVIKERDKQFRLFLVVNNDYLSEATKSLGSVKTLFQGEEFSLLFYSR